MLLGLSRAWLAYIRNTDIPGAVRRRSSLCCTDFVLNKWYFDEIYNFLFVRPAFAIGRLLWQRGDEGTIDRFGPNGSAWVVASAAAARAAADRDISTPMPSSC